MNIRFYMFGVPDGFDIYQETSNLEIVNYFQCFYDETIKENTRLAIHRKANNEVSYTYLKYRLSSAGDREGSFIGLSVVFSGGYYADVASLYNLLEYAYKGILERGLILRPTANGKSAIYQTKKFEYQVAEVRRVEAFILNTLTTKEYASEFCVWDNSFVQGKPNTQLRIPFQIYNDNPEEELALNQLIVQKLRAYSWLSLSPDYIVKPTPTNSPKVKYVELDEVLDPETKSRCKDNFEGYQKEVLSAFSEYVSRANDNLNEKVNSLSASIRNILVILNKYVKKECELDNLLDKYKGLSEKLDNLIVELNNSSSKSTPKGKSQLGDTQKDDSKQKGGKWKYILIASGVLLLAACIYACFLRPIMFPVKHIDNNADSTRVENIYEGIDFPTESEGEETGKPKLEELVAKFNQALQNNDFEAAGEYYKDVANREETGTLGKTMYDALEKKFNSLISSFDFELANKMLKECLSEVYTNTSINESELKNSFKSYVQANKKNFKKKDDLIKRINKAQEGGYEYAGIDSDLDAVKKLQESVTAKQVFKDYELLVYKESSNTPTHHSHNDTIVLECDILYKIRVADKDRVPNAILVYDENQNKEYQAWRGDSSDIHHKFKEHQILLKSNNEAETEFLYKQGDKVLFTLKVRFVVKSVLDGTGLGKI